LLLGWLLLNDFGDASATRVAIGEGLLVGFVLLGLYVAAPTTVVYSKTDDVVQVRRGTSTVFLKRSYGSRGAYFVADPKNTKIKLVSSGKNRTLMSAKSYDEAVMVAMQMSEAVRRAPKKKVDHMTDNTAPKKKKKRTGLAAKLPD